jgi:uncharacterized protein YjbI with pentapeptide repeats
VKLPRLAPSLSPWDGSIEDDLELNGVELGPSTVVPGTAAHVELIGCRLRGVRLTGCQLEHLRLIDVELDDCELSGADMTDAVFVRDRMCRCRMVGLVA